MAEGDDGKQTLDQAFDRLEEEVPERLARMLRWLRDPKSRKLRIPLALLFIVAGFLWFLPVLGLYMLPLGLMLIAQDVPVLRRPVGSAILWGIHQWRRLRAFRARRKRASAFR
ncbi:MAG: hypothetical protein ACAI38_23615 [Myxococcota bacterium]|nr:hypothetical protein [Myxococcota bacterium]